ncbi:MAG TPA: GNAT family N-acetyltransferase, partial [Mycobacterium sp.]|nr:GNAT family N-acetyltransferase [Mycobacterium sp.]
MSAIIRRAAPDDSADIAEMIHGLAEFERAPEQCTVTERQIAAALFGSSPTVHGHVAEVDGAIPAMALWFLS